MRVDVLKTLIGDDAKNIVFIIALFIVSFLILFVPLYNEPLVPGIDGPYYVIQVRWIIEKGFMKHADPPLAFYMLVPFVLLTQDYFLGVEIGVAFYVALATIPLYAFLKKESGSYSIALAGALAFIFSPYLARMYPDFMKNAIGLLWVNLFIYYLRKSLDTSSLSNQIKTFAFMVLAGLTHILDLGFSFLFLLIAIVTHTYATKKLALRPLTLLTILFLGLLFSVPAIVGGDIMKGVALIQSIVEYSDSTRLFRIEWVLMGLGIGASLIILGTVFLRNLRNLAKGVLCIAGGVTALFLNLPLIPGNWLFRLTLMSSIPLAHSLGYGLTLVKNGLKHIAIITLILALIAGTGIHAYMSIRASIPYQEYLELKHVVNEVAPPNSTFLVGDTRVRYWVETITDNVATKPSLNVQPPLVLIIEKGRPNPIPPAHKIYEGMFIEAYLLRQGPPITS